MLKKTIKLMTFLTLMSTYAYSMNSSINSLDKLKVDNCAPNNVNAPFAILEVLTDGVINISSLTLKQDQHAGFNEFRELVDNMALSLRDTTQKLRETPLADDFEKIDEMTGEFDAILLSFDKVLVATAKVIKIAVTETSTLIAKVRQELVLTKSEVAELAQHEQVLLTTAKDFEVAINAKRAYIAKAIETKVEGSTQNNMNKVIFSVLAGVGIYVAYNYIISGCNR